MVQVQIMQEDNPDLTAPPLPPPPPHQRRPRVREVSSRFMSPAVQRRPRTDPDSAAADENSETPFPMGCSVSQRKQPQRSLKLFKENNNGHEQVPPHPSKSCSGRIGSGNSTPCVSRPGTPTPSVYVSSRYRLSQQHHSNHHHHRFANGMASAAEKLMQASGLNQAKPNAACSSDDSGVNCSVQSLPELDRDMLLQSNLSVGEIIGGSNSGDLKFRHPSPLSRSVNLPSSGTEKQPPSSVSKQHGNGNQLAKSGGLSLPPVPPQSLKPAVDVRRGKKGSGHQEDVHSLRLLYNRYLQWRFANAKGHTTMKAQQVESQKVLYSQAMKISEMRESVNKKRIELEFLRRSKTLTSILEAHIPYLDEWSTMTEEYSVSITETIQALVNASVQLPVGGNVRVDVREVRDALNSALKMLETMISNIQRFVPKAEEIDISISELARIAGGEKALVGECGDLLSKTYKSQVEECCLRSQQIQLHSFCLENKNKERTNS
ncbi:LOW QUALITY PROTEIN: protein ENDOSPERM DEFECTIVE 1-like [Vigna unguiculata]|uniref:LOW QUALITY PROTEIN: protein ENDOSPERM DEFECTIVE 1-like n=1 Tax=Vigna unguiculata TaxID=3917 RepID=UPI001017093F|nr:LOW QUALITY PROTEIN: protein ENDOSPERM DEFECTIVE 1-like [Vigna unguiculata]